VGEASRRKKARAASGAAAPDPRFGAAVRELREAIVARARTIRSGIDDEPALDRVHAAASAVEALLAPDDPEAPLPAVAVADRVFVATTGVIALIFGNQDELAADDAEAVEDVASQLMAFEELPLGSRLGAVINDRSISSFIAAAVTVLSPLWDPFEPDPLAVDDLAAVAAGFACLRATLLVAAAAADAEREGDMRVAAGQAAALFRDAPAPVRELILDDWASPAWLLARGFAANGPADSNAIARRVAPQLPVAFAAGMGGAEWATGLTREPVFAGGCVQLESLFAAVPADELRQGLAQEPVLAAYAAGRAARAADGSAPWDRDA
jgi:hypothetical protein